MKVAPLPRAPAPPRRSARSPLVDALHRHQQRGRRGRRTEHFAHAGAHGPQQKLGRLLRTQHHNGQLRMRRGDLLNRLELIGIAPHAVDQHQIGMVRLHDLGQAAAPAFDL
jgi:hypothetical protein